MKEVVLITAASGFLNEPENPGYHIFPKYGILVFTKLIGQDKQDKQLYNAFFQHGFNMVIPY